jgi:hypothetical protein
MEGTNTLSCGIERNQLGGIERGKGNDASRECMSQPGAERILRLLMRADPDTAAATLPNLGLLTERMPSLRPRAGHAWTRKVRGRAGGEVQSRLVEASRRKPRGPATCLTVSDDAIVTAPSPEVVVRLHRGRTASERGLGDLGRDSLRGVPFAKGPPSFPWQMDGTRKIETGVGGSNSVSDE